MRVLDPRLLQAARPARAALGADVAAGLGVALLVLAQAWLLARIVAATFAGAAPADLIEELVLLAGAFAARGALGWGVEVAGRRAASAVLSELRLALAARRLRAQPAALDGVHAGEIAAASVQGVEALGTYFARCPAAARAGLCRAADRARRRGRRRPAVGGDHGRDAPAGAGVHVARRPLHRATHGRALAGAPAAVRALPRRRARPADVTRVQPLARRGGHARGRRRGLPAEDHGHAARRLPVRRRARAGRHARRSGRRRRRRPATRGGRARARSGTDGARARAGALPAAATPRRRVPRERGRPGGRREGARAAGRRARGRRRRARSPRPTRPTRRCAWSG